MPQVQAALRSPRPGCEAWSALRPALLMMTSMRPDSLKARVDDLVDRGRVGHVEDLGAEGVRVAFERVGDLGAVADGADDPVAALEELLGEFAAEAAVHAGDEPGSLGHEVAFQAGRVVAAWYSASVTCWPTRFPGRPGLQRGRPRSRGGS